MKSFDETGTRSIACPAAELISRMLAGTALTLLVTSVSARVGPTWSGHPAFDTRKPGARQGTGSRGGGVGRYRYFDAPDSAVCI